MNKLILLKNKGWSMHAIFAAAIALVLISRLMLMDIGLLRLGFFANFLGHPVLPVKKEAI